MKCPTCSTQLSDTAKFCDQCGTRVLSYLKEDGEAAREILLAWDSDSSMLSMPFDKWREDLRRDAMLMLAKARELLCGPKNAEIERLKADNEAYCQHEMSTAAELLDLKQQVDRLAGEARTAAANARREALEEVIESLKDGYGGFPALRARIARMRDASHPSAETQPPARDVEGLAQFLGDYVRKHTTMLSWRCFASEVFAYLDGGPSAPAGPQMCRACGSRDIVGDTCPDCHHARHIGRCLAYCSTCAKNGGPRT